MPSLYYFSALFGALAIVANPAGAGLVRYTKDFHFKSGPNHSACPQAQGTKYSVGDKTFGILCGWDTRARGHKYGPYFHLDFDQCIQRCAEKDDCSIATYTGTCYLKKSAKGRCFMRGNSPEDMSAVLLKHTKKMGKDHKDQEKQHHHKGVDANEKEKHHKTHKDDEHGKKPHHTGLKHHEGTKQHTGSKLHPGTKHHKLTKHYPTNTHVIPHKGHPVIKTAKPTTMTRTVAHAPRKSGMN